MIINETTKIRIQQLTPFALFAFALGLRLADLQGVNNYIDDCSSRSIIAAMDILNGIHHFPRLPYLFEFDDSGLGYMLVPIMRVFGKKWIIYQAAAAICGAMSITALYVFCRYCFNYLIALTAGLLGASLPVLLIWDRFPYLMNGTFMNAQTLGLILIICIALQRKFHHALPAIAGVIGGLGFYISSLMSMFIPSLIAILFLSPTPGQSYDLKIRLKILLVFSLTLVVVSAPYIIFSISNPDYYQWRARHFIEFNNFKDYFKIYFANLFSLIKEMFISMEQFQYQRVGWPVLSWFVTLIVFVGIIWRRYRLLDSGVLFCIVFPITWLILNGFIKAEQWRGVYFLSITPFMLIWAGIGMNSMFSFLSRIKNERFAHLLTATMLIAMCSWNIYAFFGGPHKYSMRTDNLTWLQLDLEKSEDIPHFFSARINDVLHYHYPFWYVTRTHLSRVSIFDHLDGKWVLMPDKKPFSFSPSEDRIAVVVLAKDVTEIIRDLGSERLISRKKLPITDLRVLQFKLKADSEAERTWTQTIIPPLIPITR